MKFDYQSDKEHITEFSEHASLESELHSGERHSAERGAVKLQVYEYTDLRRAYWFGKISGKNMAILSVKQDGVIGVRGLEGTGRAVVRCISLSPSDWGRDIIRISGVVRYNAGVAITDTVYVSRVDNVPSAIEVILTRVAGKTSAPSPTDEDYYVDNLAGAPIAVGNLVMVPYAKGTLSFRILNIHPANIAIVTKDTRFKIVTQ